MRNSTIPWLLLGAVVLAATATVSACGGATTSEKVDAGGGSGSRSGSTGGGACTSEADCASGQVCCATTVPPVITSCLDSCPILPFVGAPGQLCATSEECRTPGYNCGMLPIGPPVKFCAPLFFDGGFPLPWVGNWGVGLGVDSGPGTEKEGDAGASMDGASE